MSKPFNRLHTTLGWGLAWALLGPLLAWAGAYDYYECTAADGTVN